MAQSKVSLMEKIKSLNSKPTIIKEIEEWTKKTQQNLQSAKTVSGEIRKVIELSKEPKELSRYLVTVLSSSLREFQMSSNKYVKIAIIIFLGYKFFHVVGFLARFTNIELIKYLARYMRLLYFINYLGYFIKNWPQRPYLIDSLRSALVLVVILFIEDILINIYKLWEKIGSSIEISQLAKTSYKVTILIFLYIYLKEAKNQVINLAIFNGELIEKLIQFANNYN
ncbi:hypothetical protein ABPG72_000256 [Tetrahymena utriculariae]